MAPGRSFSSRREVQQAALSGLRTIIAALSRSARAIEARTGITNAQLFLLQQLEVSDGLSINELAKRARTGQSAVSIVVARLVLQGFVQRQRSVSDRRRVTVSLTPSGYRLLRRAPDPPTARLLAAVEELAARDLRALAHGVRSLAKGLGVARQVPQMLFEQNKDRDVRRRRRRPRRLGRR